MNNVSLHTYNPAFIKFIENIALCNFNELTIYSKNKKGNHFDLLNINFKKNSKFILIGNFTKDDFSVILRSKPSLLLYIEENFNRDIFLNSKNLSVEEVFQNNDFVELGYLFGNLSNSFSFINKL